MAPRAWSRCTTSSQSPLCLGTAWRPSLAPLPCSSFPHKDRLRWVLAGTPLTARLPFVSGWSAGRFASLRSPSLRSIRAAHDGSALRHCLQSPHCSPAMSCLICLAFAKLSRIAGARKIEWAAILFRLPAFLVPVERFINPRPRLWQLESRPACVRQKGDVFFFPTLPAMYNFAVGEPHLGGVSKMGGPQPPILWPFQESGVWGGRKSESSLPGGSFPFLPGQKGAPGGPQRGAARLCGAFPG